MSAARAVAKRVVVEAARRWAPRREDLPPSTWRLERDAAGSLALDGLPLAELLDRYGSPLHVVDAQRLASNASAFLAVPTGARAGCEAFVSYKTNPVPAVLRRLHARGVGAEVSSPFELWLALELGVDPASIVYDGPAKSRDSLRLALERGVGLVNVDGRGELDEIAGLARSLGVRPRVGVRVVPPGCFGGQFGERVDTGAALDAFRVAASHPELRVVAVHAHRNGSMRTEAELDAFVSGVLAFVDELAARLGIGLEIVDLGGNLACPTVRSLSPAERDRAVTFGFEPLPAEPGAVLGIDRYVARVVERVRTRFEARRRPLPRVFLEPGRALMGNAQILLARVIALRDADETGLRWALLDAGFHVAEPVRNELHQLFAIRGRSDAPRHLYRILGPTCSVGDILYPAWRLPELRVGDGVAIMDTGAYFVPASMCFSFPRPGVAIVEAGVATLARRPERFADVIALDDVIAPGRA